MTDNILQEVDAALRADRAAGLWHKHKTSILTVMAAIIFATAAQSGWQYYREQRGGALLEKLSAAKALMVSGKSENAAQQFAAIADAASGEMKALALVWQARAETTMGKGEVATKTLIAATQTGVNLWSDIACLRLAGLDATAAKPCLEAKTESPLKDVRAQWAAANAWEQGDSATAIAAVEAMIADEKTSLDSKQQLEQWLAVMRGKEGK